MREYMAAQAACHRLSIRHDPVFLSKLIDSEEYSSDWPAQALKQWCAGVSDRMNQDTPPSVNYDLRVIEAEDGMELEMQRTTHGVVEVRKIGRDFFRSPDYRLIGRVASTLHGFSS